jgi:dUTP pyrophosphatase
VLAKATFKAQGEQVTLESYLEGFSVKLLPREVKIIPTGLKIELPVDVELDIKSRSGLFSREGLLVQGTIDPDYRGEIGIMMMNLSDKEVAVRHGERVAQGVFRQVLNADALLVEVKEEGSLSVTARGEGGFGSTGKG